MSTSIEPFAAVSESPEPESLGVVHLAVERKHDRAAVLRYRVATTWQDMPDWRFHRHAMRIGLYLRERAQLTTEIGSPWSARSVPNGGSLSGAR